LQEQPSCPSCPYRRSLGPWPQLAEAGCTQYRVSSAIVELAHLWKRSLDEQEHCAAPTSLKECYLKILVEQQFRKQQRVREQEGWYSMITSAPEHYRLAIGVSRLSEEGSENSTPMPKHQTPPTILPELMLKIKVSGNMVVVSRRKGRDDYSISGSISAFYR